MTLALLVVDNFLIGYKLYILICARHLKSGGKEVVLRLLPSLFTKAKLHRFWRKHSILEWSEPFMIFFFKSKHSINVLNVKVELMTSNPALYVILFEWCTSVKFSNQRITNSGEFAKKFIPAPFLKTTRNEGILKIINIHCLSWMIGAVLNWRAYLSKYWGEWNNHHDAFSCHHVEQQFFMEPSTKHSSKDHKNKTQWMATNSVRHKLVPKIKTTNQTLNTKFIEKFKKMTCEYAKHQSMI